jgi:hypothetical protein
MKIRVLIVISVLFALLVPTGPASASWVTYQSSPNDRFNAADVKPEYDVVSVDVATSDTTPTEIYFFLEFAQRVTNTQFADGRGSWASVMLDMDNDGKADFSMDTSAQSYTNNFYHTAKFTNRQGVVPMSDSRCMAITWTDLVNDAKWIAFRIQRTCLNFTGTFGVRGYVDFNSSDNATSDWAPDDFWKVNLAGGVIPTPTPTPTPTSTISTNQIAIDAKKAANLAKIAAQDAYDGFTTSKENCFEISNFFEDELVQELFESTELDSYCSQLDLQASSLLRKIEALDPETVRTTEAANREIDAANKLAGEADALNAEIQDIADELSSTESLLSDLVEANIFFGDYQSDSIEQIDLLKERIGMLPAALQAMLKKSKEFKSLATFQARVETVVNSKDRILEVFTGIKRPSQITPTINSINSLKSQLPSLNTLKKSIQTLEKKIPAVVCQKGSLVVSASKTGKCAKGFESIPTS